MESGLLFNVRQNAKKLKKRIVLAEGEEERIIRAAAVAQHEHIADITLLGRPEVIKSKAQDLDLTGISIVDYAADPCDEFANTLYELRKAKGVDLSKAHALLKDPLYYGVMMVKEGIVDGMVAGSICATGDVLRPALQIIKTAPGIKTVSSCFIMVLPNPAYGENGILVFGDCAVNPNPDSNQLADIAIASANSARNIAGIKNPNVALLSYSTKGSASGELVDKVKGALEVLKAQNVDFAVDGELQADAALVPTVAALKAPESDVAGKANVLIFPDLQAGNIGYKLVQRLAGADAVGPICQGFNKPVNDLSRGCSVEDVVNVIAMTALQAQNI